MYWKAKRIGELPERDWWVRRDFRRDYLASAKRFPVGRGSDVHHFGPYTDSTTVRCVHARTLPSWAETNSLFSFYITPEREKKISKSNPHDTRSTILPLSRCRLS